MTARRLWIDTRGIRALGVDKAEVAARVDPDRDFGAWLLVGYAPKSIA